MVDTPRPQQYAYTPPTKQTAYGPDTNEMSWDKMSGSKKADPNDYVQDMDRADVNVGAGYRGAGIAREGLKSIGITKRGRDEDPIVGRGT